MKWLWLLALALLLVGCECEPCVDTTYYITSEYKVEPDGNFTYTITVPPCDNETFGMCAARDPELDRCVMVIK